MRPQPLCFNPGPIHSLKAVPTDSHNPLTQGIVELWGDWPGPPLAGHCADFTALLLLLPAYPHHPGAFTCLTLATHQDL